MAYNKEKLFEESKELIKNKIFFFVEDVIASLGCHKSTFYEYFPINSDESDELKRLLDENKIRVKSGLRKKWYDSDNPTTQLVLYKLICTDAERRNLSSNYNDVTTNGEKIEPVFTINIIDNKVGFHDNEDEIDNEQNGNGF